MTARTWAPRGAHLAQRLAFHSTPIATGCILWTAGTDRDGYGYIQINGRKVRAHRAAFELAKGTLPPDVLVRHGCDTPACINPDHLVAGDGRLNAQDRVHRDRFDHQSSRYNRVRLSMAAARQIRAKAAGGATHRQLALQFGVGRHQISRVINHHNWKEKA